MVRVPHEALVSETVKEHGRYALSLVRARLEARGIVMKPAPHFNNRRPLQLEMCDRGKLRLVLDCWPNDEGPFFLMLGRIAPNSGAGSEVVASYVDDWVALTYSLTPARPFMEFSEWRFECDGTNPFATSLLVKLGEAVMSAAWVRDGNYDRFRAHLLGHLPLHRIRDPDSSYFIEDGLGKMLDYFMREEGG